MALFNVTNLFDSGMGSLRQAILDANTNVGADTIQFSSITGTIPLTSGQLSISDSLTINGPGANNLSVSGNNLSRVFYINNPSATIDVLIDGLTITGGNSFSGGGIYNRGENLTLNNSTISGNRGNFGGGGVGNRDGTTSISNSTISDNTTIFSGGGVENSGGETNISNSTISGNTAIFDGGGVENSGGTTNISNSTISNNTANYSGGGVYNTIYGTTNISNSTISGNTANIGGGVRNNGVTTSISNSTISNNTASFGGGVGNDNATMSISNSTISGNTANIGGGVRNVSGTTSISNSTISGNTASFGGGVDNFYYSYSSTLNLANTIIANSPNGGDCRNNGTIATNINNLIEDGTCNPLLSGDPNLGPLQDNGGPTFTQALLPGSIAIDAGSNAAIPPGITTDQRGPGFPRIFNGTVDIGAYEASQNVPPSVPESSSLFGVLTLGLVAISSLRRRKK